MTKLECPYCKKGQYNFIALGIHSSEDRESYSYIEKCGGCGAIMAVGPNHEIKLVLKEPDNVQKDLNGEAATEQQLTMAKEKRKDREQRVSARKTKRRGT